MPLTKLGDSVQGRLLIAVDDASAVQIVGAKLDGDAITGEDADEVLPHAARDVRENLMLILKLDLEQRIRQRFNDDCHDFNCIFLRQTISFDEAGKASSAFVTLLVFFVGF